ARSDASASGTEAAENATRSRRLTGAVWGLMTRTRRDISVETRVQVRAISFWPLKAAILPARSNLMSPAVRPFLTATAGIVLAASLAWPAALAAQAKPAARSDAMSAAL